MITGKLLFMGIIGVAALVLFIILLSKTEAMRRYLQPGSILLLLVAAAAVAAFCIFFMGKEIIRNSMGPMTTDYADAGSPAAGGEEDGILVITVHVDTLQIGDQTYDTVAEVEPFIAQALRDGKKLRIIDDYAQAATYHALMAALHEMNADATGIEETREP